MIAVHPDQARLDLDAPATRGASRHSDPQTSKDAARSIRMKERKREVVEAMTRLRFPSTARQIQQDMAQHGIQRERGSVASRLSQLEHDHLVAKVGIRNVPTSAGGTGRDEATWSLVL